jgi:antibiotic biosynthesis monooxygenase (ABM) superfamily enzyme
VCETWYQNDEGRTWVKGAWRKGAEENVWTKERGRNKWLDRGAVPGRSGTQFQVESSRHESLYEAFVVVYLFIVIYLTMLSLPTIQRLYYYIAFNDRVNDE